MRAPFRTRRPARRSLRAVVLLVTALAAVLLVPSAASAAPGPPGGSLDEVTAGPGGVRVRGWAIDPDTAAPITVHIYVGNQAVALVADGERRDVGEALPAYGTKHGFDTLLPTSAGTHQVCVYGINVGPGNNALIGCKTVSVGGSPIGAFDAVAQRPSGLHVRGWVIDPDVATPAAVHVYRRIVGGPGIGNPTPWTVTAHTADGYRGDVGWVYPFYGDQHGFAIDLPVVDGFHEVCVYALNVAGPGTNQFMGCQYANAFVDVVAFVEDIERTTDGLRFSGLAIDPQTDDPLTVTFSVDGVEASGMANVAHNGYQWFGLEGYSALHGFSITVPAGTSLGEHEACITIPNAPGTAGKGVDENCVTLVVTTDDVQIVVPVPGGSGSKPPTTPPSAAAKVPAAGTNPWVPPTR